MGLLNINNGVSQKKGIDYTVIIDNINDDFGDVSNNTYFLDKETQLVYYKNSTGDLVSIFEQGGSDITGSAGNGLTYNTTTGQIDLGGDIGIDPDPTKNDLYFTPVGQAVYITYGLTPDRHAPINPDNTAGVVTYHIDRIENCVWGGYRNMIGPFNNGNHLPGNPPRYGVFEDQGAITYIKSYQDLTPAFDANSKFITYLTGHSVTHFINETRTSSQRTIYSDHDGDTRPLTKSEKSQLFDSFTWEVSNEDTVDPTIERSTSFVIRRTDIGGSVFSDDGLNMGIFMLRSDSINLMDGTNSGIMSASDFVFVGKFGGSGIELGSNASPSGNRFIDGSDGKKGIKYSGFGETDGDTGVDADYTTLVNTSLVPKKYVDDAISNTNGGNTTTELLSQEWIVDPINGDDVTGINGSYINAFSTIEGAENAATSGDVIKIISDVTEAGMGKDGIEYRINPGVEIFYPESGSNTPRTGLTQAFLWTDEGKGPISFKVYGGIHKSEGDWYGNYNRGIVYIFNEGSDIRIYGEHVELKGNDGWISKVSAKCNLEIHSVGDIISGYSGIQTYTSQDSTILFNAGGSIIGSVRMVDEQNLSGNTIIFNAGKMIQSLGHPISTLRSFIYCNSSSSTSVSHISLNSPVIDIFEDNHSTLSNTQGFIFTFQHGKIKLDINADVITMRNPDTVTNPNSYGLFSLYRTTTTEIDIVMNVKRVILGTSFALGRGGQSYNKLNARIRWINNTEIIFKTAVLETGNAFNCDRLTHYFEGLTKIIINPDAITLGQKALGGSLDNNAYIVGKVISNGDIYDNTFVNTFNGVDYATGIPELTMLNSTLINWDHYKNL